MAKLILDGVNWVNHSALLEPNNIFSVEVQTCTSRFDKNRSPKYLVVANGVNSLSYRVELTIKTFDTPQKAADFAAKLAHLINEEDLP